MCRCTPEIRTPWCGKPGCEAPEQTASMQSFEDFERKNGERILDARVRHFFEQYAPTDRRQSARFHSDFFMLVQEIHKSASERSNDIMMKFAESMPLKFNLG